MRPSHVIVVHLRFFPRAVASVKTTLCNPSVDKQVIRAGKNIGVSVYPGLILETKENIICISIHVDVYPYGCYLLLLEYGYGYHDTVFNFYVF